MEFPRARNIAALASGYAALNKAEPKGSSCLTRTRKTLQSFVFAEFWDQVWTPLGKRFSRVESLAQAGNHTVETCGGINCLR